ncbi:hypothetical protein EYF80_018466 [Liparis tanakae]|uniref:Uncharacterized protein n=1 Tax=Liparis tanakae TaxID=230148 RepID=A0A4Z2I1U2_9TELE|nr:hypothetical protein EYF80_018466 [Liparis tanakae]
MQLIGVDGDQCDPPGADTDHLLLNGAGDHFTLNCQEQESCLGETGCGAVSPRCASDALPPAWTGTGLSPICMEPEKTKMDFNHIFNLAKRD